MHCAQYYSIIIMFSYLKEKSA